MLHDNVGKIDDNRDGGVDSGNKERVELVLVLLSNLYSKLESISVDTSEPSFNPTLHYPLTT